MDLGWTSDGRLTESQKKQNALRRAAQNAAKQRRWRPRALQQRDEQTNTPRSLLHASRSNKTWQSAAAVAAAAAAALHSGSWLLAVGYGALRN